MTSNRCPDCRTGLDLPDLEFGYRWCSTCAITWGWSGGEPLGAEGLS